MTPEEQQAEQHARVGKTLRQLREKKNLTIAEVASQMRLDPRLIEALETENYTIFAADTYIRGYLRNYAKMLGINSDEIIAMYQTDAPPPPEIIPNVKHPTQISSSDKPVKLFSYLITLILVLLLIIWWRQSDFSIIKSFSLKKIAETTATAIAVEPMTTTPNATGHVKENVAGGNMKVQESVPATLELSTAVSFSQPSPTPTTMTTVPDTTTSSAVTAQSGDEEQAVPGPDSIHLKLKADCWVEIRDRFNKKVYQDLARIGNDIHLNGFAPFRVELGNAQGVTLEFNDKPYDPAPVTMRGIARFTLGQ